MVTSINASDIDDGLKKQCQYIVHGNGSTDLQYNAYLLGVVSGIQHMTIEITDYGEISSYADKRHKVCKNALSNIGKSGFDSDYKREATKLISKE